VTCDEKEPDRPEQESGATGGNTSGSGSEACRQTEDEQRYEGRLRSDDGLNCNR
jgi:hypothetical protein